MAAERRRRWLRWIIGVVVVLVVLGIIGVWFIRSGIYNVSATYPDSAPVAWVMSTTMDNSVRRHARGIKAPALDDPAMILTGMSHYRRMCVICHGAPGVKIGEIGQGLRPDPPELTEAAGDWKPNELFWIIKNGVRMTGMPSFGVTHSDKEIWEIVALVRKLPSMTPFEYKALSHLAR